MTQNDVAAWKAWQASQGGGGNSVASSSSSKSSSSLNQFNSTIPGVGKNGLPSFLPTNNNSQLGELKQLLGQLPGMFDTSGVEKSYDQQIQFGSSVGEQASNNAAREFINRQSLQGGDRSLGGLVRAQSMLPFLQQNAELTGKKESAKLDASANLAKMQGDVATSLGQLRTSYLGTLANYTSNLQSLSSHATLEQQKNAQQNAEFNASLGLDKQRLGMQQSYQNAQLNQNQQQIDLQRLLALSKLRRDNSTTVSHNLNIDWGNNLAPYSALR